MYQNIQMLRGLAAMSVMLCHGAAIHQEAVGSTSWPMTFIARFGYIGVDLFFVISGFVAAHTTLYRKRDLRDVPQYLCQRLARIYLGYWPFYALSLVVAAIYKPELLEQWNWISSFLLAFLIGVNEGKELVLYVSWSLSYELLFYAMVATTFALTPRSAVFALQAAALFLATAMAISLSHTTPLALWTFLAFLFEFVLGALIRVKTNLFHGRLAGAFAIALISISFYFGFRSDTLLVAERALSIGSGCAGILMLVLVAEQSKYCVAQRWIAALGNSSYTLYLAHSIFWSLLGYWSTAQWLAQWPPLIGMAGFWILVMSFVGLCHLYSTYIELPLYRWSNSAWTRNRQKASLGNLKN